MPRQSWTREQDLAVLYLKVAIGKNVLTQKHPDIFKIAQAMGRTDAAIWMRKLNFDYLDPSVSGGYSNAAKQTERIWDEYQFNPDSTLAKARKAYLNLVQDTI
jgi:hypothetical protein